MRMGAPVDLNAIRSFVLLYETRSVTRTAQRLHVTQPTVSYTLQRLRRRFRDELFRRSPSGLLPTSTARALYPALHRALFDIDRAVAGVETFNPAETTEEFTVCLSDIGELAFLPQLVVHLSEQAPRSRVRSRPLVVDTAVGDLTAGEADAVITSADVRQDRVQRHVLLVDDYVVVAAASHPRVRSRLTRARFVAERHVEVRGTAGHTGPAEALAGKGVDRTVGLEVTTFRPVPDVVEQTELLAILPRRIAAQFAHAHPLRMYEIPWAVPPIEVALFARHDHAASAAQRWFVQQVRQACEPSDPPVPAVAAR